MRSTVILVIVLAAGVLTSCSVLGLDSNACPETVEDGGLVEGIDLPAPEWLPTGFPLPAGVSLRHLNHLYLGDADIVTGFIPDGDVEAIVAFMRTALAEAGYEKLLAAEGFVPVANDAFVTLSGGTTARLVSVGAVEQDAPVRVSEDECPRRPGVLLTLRLESVDAEAARARYENSSLTHGTAGAVIAGVDYVAKGECFIHDDTYTFSTTADGDLIGLQFDQSGARAVGHANVDVEGEAVFNLDAETSAPTFLVTTSGFSVAGTFIDGLGDAGRVDGTVDVTCR